MRIWLSWFSNTSKRRHADSAGKGVEEFLGEDKVTAVKAGGEVSKPTFSSRLWIRAATQLAVDAGIPLGETRAI
jgi:hypothetical protein